MMPLRHPVPLLEEEKSILRTLLYFDIFNYPLTESEIGSFSPMTFGDHCQSALGTLTNKQIVYLINGFYSLRNDPFLVTRRNAGNLLAQKKMGTARKFSRLISLFPFVRSVMLSGSISKGYMDENSDIDYFIITAAGRLWFVRAAMALFRRIFLFNSHKYFCTNYFIDSEHLEIGEKNIFTAIEASTLKPMFGKSCVYQFQAANQWCYQYLPNHKHENGLGKERGSLLKNVGEKILSNKLLDRLDRWLMKKFVAYWEVRYHHLLNENDFSIAFQSTEHVSRSHPGFYQKKVLSLYESKILEFEEQHGLSLEL